MGNQTDRRGTTDWFRSGAANNFVTWSGGSTALCLQRHYQLLREATVSLCPHDWHPLLGSFIHNIHGLICGSTAGFGSKYTKRQLAN